MILALLGGVVGGVLMWPVSAYGASNLQVSQARSSEVILVAISGMCGMLAGRLISRRGNTGNYISFGATVGAVCAGLAGAAFAVVMDFAYLRTFGGSPTGGFDLLLVIVSFPVFAALGAMVAMVPGAAIGACVSAIWGQLQPKHL